MNQHSSSMYFAVRKSSTLFLNNCVALAVPVHNIQALVLVAFFFFFLKTGISSTSRVLTLGQQLV